MSDQFTLAEVDAARQIVKGMRRRGKDFFAISPIRMGFASPAEEEEFISDPQPLVIPEPVEAPAVPIEVQPEKELVPA